MTDVIITRPSEHEGLPIIAIIGRPNVGKSTLFNRLVGKRRAITDPTPGVTRDPIPERWLLGNHPVLLIDSGGVKLEQEGLDNLVTRKSLGLLEDADVILFLMDCTEVTAEDLMLTETLRPFADKVLLVVNKVDDIGRDDLVWNFFSYGYQRVLGISSAHGHGIGELEETLLGMLSLEEQDEAPEELHSIKLAVMGKPNTGKSTLTNLLTGHDLSIVSDIPGTTRDVVKGKFSFNGADFTILDTAGIRRKSKVDEDVEYYSVNRAIKTIDEADVVLLMVDATEGLADQDKKIASLIVRRGKGIILVLNKIDLLAGVPNQIEAIQDRVRFLFPILGFAPMVAISAHEGTQIDVLLNTVKKVWQQLNKRIDTAVLNSALKDWGEAYQPPRGSKGYFKVYYGTQVSITPVRFLFFINRMKGFPQVYVQYLKNCIRKDLGFSSIPVEVDLRERRRNPAAPGDRSESIAATIREEGTAPKKPEKPTGGKAKAALKTRKPGNKAAAGKARERAAKQKKQSSTKRKK